MQLNNNKKTNNQKMGRRTVWRFLKKLQIELPYDPAIPLLGIHTKETRIERDTCPPVFIAALFTIARTWKQPRCPSADKWIRKLWYIFTMEYSVQFSSVAQLCLTLCNPMNQNHNEVPFHTSQNGCDPKVYKQ